MLGFLVRWADRVTAAAAVAVLVGLLATVVLGVVFRTLGDPLVWSDELARYLMVWLALIGWILAARRRSHIRITLLLARLPAGGRRVAEVAIQCALVAFGIFLVRDGLSLVERNLDVEAVSMPIPSALLYLPAVLAGLAVALQALAQALEAFGGREAAAPVAAGGEVL